MQKIADYQQYCAIHSELPPEPAEFYPEFGLHVHRNMQSLNRRADEAIESRWAPRFLVKLDSSPSRVLEKKLKFARLIYGACG